MATTKAYELARLLADGFVGSSEIGSDQVLNANIADNAVTTNKIANSSITASKLNVASDDIPYDNTVSGLSANTVKQAIDALNALSGGGNAGSQATFSREKFVATAGQTAFTVTGGYDVGYLLVFMNGVLLDISDFTASDGVGFTLAVAAKAGDEIVAIKLDSFAIAELLRIFSTSASAPDDSVIVDASGSLLVGTTDSSLYNNTSGGGFHASANGFTEVAYESANAADPAFLVNNTGAAGDTIQLRKDGSVVGSLGNYGGSGIYLDAPTSIRFSQSGGTGSNTRTVRFANFSGGGSGYFGPNNDVNSDGYISLGTGDGRWGNLYLSGGVFLGGAGSANYLDSYEEGTFTVYIIDSAGNPQSGYSYGNQAGSYTKIGNMVNVRIVLSTTGGVSDGNPAYFNLPFAVSNADQSAYASVAPLTRYVSFGTNQYPVVESSKGTSRMAMLKCTSNGTTSVVVNNDLGSSFNLNVSFSYQTT
jgi:hypothetical protein